MPVRPSVAAVRDVPYPARLAGGDIHLLVFGGSQGATVFARVVPEALARISPKLSGKLRIAQQCRREDAEAVDANYKRLGVEAEVAPFFDDLPRRIAEAHLVIARSGASTVAELMAIGRPAILVPYPHAMDDHQTDNAALMARAGAAWAMPQKSLDAQSLAQALAAALQSPSELAAKAEAAHKLAIPHAAENLADMVEQLARKAA